jgi:hypothetical protein
MDVGASFAVDVTGALAPVDRPVVPRLVTEPDLGDEAAAALAQAIHAEGLDHPGPSGLRSAWRRAALAEGVERGP